MAKVLAVIETESPTFDPAHLHMMCLNGGYGGVRARVPTAEEVGELADEVAFWFKGDGPDHQKVCRFEFDQGEAEGRVRLTGGGYGVAVGLDGRDFAVLDCFPGTERRPNQLVVDHPDDAEEPALKVVPMPDGSLAVAVNQEAGEERTTTAGPAAIHSDGTDAEWDFFPGEEEDDADRPPTPVHPETP